MKNSVNISVVIPVYNAAHTLAETLDSILQQTRQPLEIICIDDGSIDESVKILKLYENRLPLKIIQQKNQGVSAARNVGTAAAQGDYIAFLDADDLWHCKKIERCKQVIKHHQPDILAHGFEQFWQNAQTRGIYTKKSPSLLPTPFAALYSGNFIGTSTVMVCKKRLQKTNGFNTTLKVCEDWDLWLNILQQPNVKLYFMAENLTRYRIGNTGLGSQVLSMYWAHFSLIIKYGSVCAAHTNKSLSYIYFIKMIRLTKSSIHLALKKKHPFIAFKILCYVPYICWYMSCDVYKKKWKKT